MIYILIAVALVGAAVTAYHSNIQATTLWLGNEIERLELIRITPTSFASATEIQTIITPKGQAAGTCWMFMFPILVLGIGFYIK